MRTGLLNPVILTLLERRLLNRENVNLIIQTPPESSKSEHEGRGFGIGRISTEGDRGQGQTCRREL